MHRLEQLVPLVQIAPREQVPTYVPPIQQVEPLPQANVDIHEIHNDLEEENYTSSCPVNVYTSMTSFIPTTQLLVQVSLIHHFPNFLFLNSIYLEFL